MSSAEKFLFDTIFDELEPVIPELAEEEFGSEKRPNELIESDLQNEILPAFTAEDLEKARQEGFETGKNQRIEELLVGVEKDVSDTLGNILDKINILSSEQAEVNQTISVDATTLALTIIRKFFPSLSEQTAANEVIETVKKFIGRLVDEPTITVKTNTSIQKEIQEKLSVYAQEKGLNQDLTIMGDENLDIGDCKIEWSNGSAERNLSILMKEIDDIVLKHSTFAEKMFDPDEEPNKTEPENSLELDNDKSKSTSTVEDSTANNDELLSSDVTSEPIIKDPDVVLSDRNTENAIISENKKDYRSEPTEDDEKPLVE